MLHSLADSGDLPTALYTSSDMVALGVMKAAIERSLRIPEDFSLVGYDDIMFASLPTVMLTTVAQPRFEIGRLAMELLCQAIESNSQEKKFRAIVRPTLVERSTTRRFE